MKKICLLLSSSKPQFFYHATYEAHLPKILKYGLIGTGTKKNWNDSKDVVYLADDQNVAFSYCETSDDVPESWLDQIVVFKIPSSRLLVEKLHRDSNVIDGNHTYEYHDVIQVTKSDIL